MNMIVKRGDVWWCDFSTGVGREQSGLRPAIIVSNKMCNEHSSIVTVVPLTTATKTLLPCHVELTGNDCKGLRKPNTALCEQVRTVDKGRLKDYVGKLEMASMKKVDTALAVQVGI